MNNLLEDYKDVVNHVERLKDKMKKSDDSYTQVYDQLIEEKLFELDKLHAAIRKDSLRNY